MNDPRVILVVTGTRAEFGLLRPVMRAIKLDGRLELRVVVTGPHLLEPALTVNEVESEFAVFARVEMQRAGETGRGADAQALGRGVSGLAEVFDMFQPDVVLVLGDRIEAFAAAAAAAVAGIRVAHLHGGDRAEGIADDALRNAISKFAHIHLPATGQSAERLICMGEAPLSVHLVGSPAIDGLNVIPPLPDDRFEALGQPDFLVLLHPSGLSPDDEWSNAERLLRLAMSHGRVLALNPNLDPGREAIMDALEAADCPRVEHLPRAEFVGLLRRVRCLLGNSSAGLIECAALGVPCINVGRRQSGREMPANVIDVPDWDLGSVDLVLESLGARSDSPPTHPYGDGNAGVKTATVLATFNLEHHPLAKRNTY